MTDQLATLLSEQRRFPPDPDFAAAANAQPELLRQARADRLAFWDEQARFLDWMTPWRQTLEWTLPHAKWFVGGELNVSANCLDRHLSGPRRNKAALIWEGEPGDRRVLTYWDLAREVQRAANALKDLGVGRGDRVAIYLPMIPEAAIAMLACTRIGAVHSVVFGGFSAESLRDRINDAQAKLLITADGGYRRGSVLPLKRIADEAIAACPSIENVLVVRRRAGGEGDEAFAHMEEGRDHWWHRALDAAAPKCEPEAMDSEDLLFILYTSGTTGKPKGIVHTTGGYLTQAAATTRYVFDLKEDDVFWCTADIGWVTGHSYVVYGPLANGATVVMYEGAPDWPDRDRFWEIVARYGVTVFYTAPTAIRAFMKWGPQFANRHDLSTLRLLGSVGEPINPEAWIWYHHHIGGNRCPIVDTWWQTETGGIMITPLPGITTTKPGSATVPFPGISAELVDTKGNRLEQGGGFLTLTEPWPGMLRTIYGDDQRYQETYWSRFPGRYFAGDGAKVDEDGYWWVLGRVDDVMNVAGHRIGSMEIESALVDHPSVAEAAVVGKHHDLKEHVTKKIGAIARPDDIFFSADLPKTRSGKIMRRLLKDIAEGRALGDTTTLADPAVVARLKDQYESEEG
ncbi:MAG: acetate--CoA ligase [Gemmatimonadales bacterium]